MSAKTTVSSVQAGPRRFRPSRRGGRAAAFTLLELLLVAALLAVMAGALAPRMNGAYRSLQFRGEIHQIAALVNYASEVAVRARREVELHFVQGGDRLWLEGEGLERFGRQRNPYHHAGRAVTIRSEAQDLQTGETVVLRFFPDGSRTEDLLTVRDSSGRMRWIEIGRSFAELGVTREKPGEAEP